jgi:signal transduction histidine kinase
VFVLLPTGRDAEAVCEALNTAGVRTRKVSRFDEILSSIGPDCGPLLVAQDGLSAEDVGKLLGKLEGQPSWSEIPVVVLLGADAGISGDLGALACRPSTTVLRRPLEPSVLVGLMEAAVDSRQRQFEVRDLLEQLRGRTDQLERLALQSTRAEERERARIAGILHDDLQQLLAYAKIRTKTIEPERDSDGSAVAAIEDVKGALSDAISITRTLSHELHPPLLYTKGLGPALQWLARQMSEKHSLEVDVEVTRQGALLPREIAAFAYQAVSELLFNVVKHAGVNQVCLRMERGKNSVKIVVADEGAGIDVDALRAPEDGKGGFGLWHIRERASLFGGTFDATGAPDRGSRFVLVLPDEM